MELILTDRSLLGLHLTSKNEGIKNQEYFSQEPNLSSVLDQAKEKGVKKILMVPADPLLSLMAQNRHRWPFEIFGMVPHFQQFVRDTSHYGTTGAAVRRVLSMPHLKKLRLIKVAVQHLPKVLGMKFEIAMNLFLMAEAAGFRKPKALILHSQITDLALSLGQEDFFRIFKEVAENELGAESGAATINYVRLEETFKRLNLSYPWILAPFNPRGFQMNPTSEACLETARNSKSKIIADHWNLASQIQPDEARSFLSKAPFAAATVELNDILLMS